MPAWNVCESCLQSFIWISCCKVRNWHAPKVSEWFLKSIMFVPSVIQFQKFVCSLYQSFSLTHRLMQKLSFQQTNWTHKMDVLSVGINTKHKQFKTLEQSVNSFCCWFAFWINRPLIWHGAKCGSYAQRVYSKMPTCNLVSCRILWLLNMWRQVWTMAEASSLPGQMWQVWTMADASSLPGQMWQSCVEPNCVTFV